MNSILAQVGILALIASRLVAFDDFISVERFSENEIIILAESTLVEEFAFCQVVNESEYDDERPFRIPQGEGVKLDKKTVEDYYYSDQMVPPHQAKLYDTDPNPSKEDRMAAEAKDAEEKAQAVERMKALLLAKNLKKKSEGDYIVYYYSGRAKMKVIECLKGGLEPGEVITVSWDRVMMKTTCPVSRPDKGTSGWILNRGDSESSSYTLTNSFRDWAKATKIAEDQKSVGEGRGADQSSTTLKSNSEGISKPQAKSVKAPKRVRPE